ncbi:MAG: SDR family NAD(P)-dependent oxidoreductase [Chroococcidiopsidaceae cyanobacterium CP_BM_RX_35]|nr:SDR family NAD(P)-dependent oxidoreductase [Chroococcidiopsidaceae cyanobacterium CP_BM_RX_35]
MLANQKVVVIGVSSGIGLVIAQGVAEAGVEVMLSSRSAEKLNQLASAIGEQAKVTAVDDV